MLKPSIQTSGFSVVDLIDNGTGYSAAPGGTAVNVAEALASLGWTAEVVGEIGTDYAGSFLRASLLDDNVIVKNLSPSPSRGTPVLRQVNVDGDHDWAYDCPHCGNRYPKYGSPSAAEAKRIVKESELPTVYYYDRANPFANTLAKLWKREGVLVVFEPSVLGDLDQFKTAAKQAAIIKYSSQRSAAFETHLRETKAALIKTDGPRGVSFRILEGDTWEHVPVVSTVTEIVDSVGCGDWTTAGFLESLFKIGYAKEIYDRISNSEDMVTALNAGQMLGAEACSWAGFRPSSWVPPRGSKITDIELFCPLQ